MAWSRPVNCHLLRRPAVHLRDAPLDHSPRLPVRQHPHEGLPLFDGHWGASDEGLQPRQGDAGEKRDLIQGPTAADAGEFELWNLPVAVVWRIRHKSVTAAVASFQQWSTGSG